MTAEDRDFAVTMIVAGVIGFAAGLARAEHQVAVETAQVLAGLVEYPPDNPFYVYHLKLWNLGSQILALALVLGAPERILSLALSGLIGALSFQAIALCGLAMGANRWLALVLPPWILAVAAFALGVSYPIMPLGSPHSYGMIGTSYALFTLALLGLGRTAAGLFLLGLAPAVHPSIGVWTLGVGVLSLPFGGSELRARLRGHGRFFAYGAAIAMVSLAGQLWIASAVDLPATSTPELAIRAFVRDWDGHRKPVPFSHRVLSLTMGFVVLAAAWSQAPRLRAALPRYAPVLLRALAVSGALGVSFCVLTNWQDHLPVLLLVAMPGRHVNLSSLALAPVLLGLLGGRGQGLAGALLLLAVSISTGVAVLSSSVPGPIWMNRALVLAVAALVAWRLARRAEPERSARAIRPDAVARALAVTLFAATAFAGLRPDPLLVSALAAIAAGLVLAIDPPARLLVLLRSGALVRLAGIGVALVATCLCVTRGAHLHGAPLDMLTDYGNDPFFAKVAEGEGPLLTAGDLGLVQLRTRRSVVIDGSGLDGLPYAPDSAPRVLRVLREIYGEDLYQPSAEIRERRPGALLPDTGSRAWHARSAEAWSALAREFGFREILTPASWRLRLPRLAESGTLALYRVPDAQELAPNAAAGDGAVR